MTTCMLGAGGGAGRVVMSFLCYCDLFTIINVFFVPNGARNRFASTYKKVEIKLAYVGFYLRLDFCHILVQHYDSC